MNVLGVAPKVVKCWFYCLCEQYRVSDLGANQRALHATLLEEVWGYPGWSVLE